MFARVRKYKSVEFTLRPSGGCPCFPLMLIKTAGAVGEWSSNKRKGEETAKQGKGSCSKDHVKNTSVYAAPVGWGKATLTSIPCVHTCT